MIAVIEMIYAKECLPRGYHYQQSSGPQEWLICGQVHLVVVTESQREARAWHVSAAPAFVEEGDDPRTAPYLVLSGSNIGLWLGWQVLKQLTLLFKGMEKS